MSRPILPQTLFTPLRLHPEKNRNKDFATLASVDYLSDPSHCPVSPPNSSGPTRHLLLAEGQDPDDYTPTFFLEAAGACTAISVVGGLLLGLGSLVLVQKRPHACVGAAVGLQVNRVCVTNRGCWLGWFVGFRGVVAEQRVRAGQQGGRGATGWERVAETV